MRIGERRRYGIYRHTRRDNYWDREGGKKGERKKREKEIESDGIWWSVEKKPMWCFVGGGVGGGGGGGKGSWGEMEN